MVFAIRRGFQYGVVSTTVIKMAVYSKGATENARLELSAPSKMQGWKMRDQAAMESQNTCRT